jgi:lactate dehydrogenase-like 2-hydroxyacid dehydrogenase
LVGSQALYDGLENGQLLGLGMDVYENEGELLRIGMPWAAKGHFIAFHEL